MAEQEFVWWIEEVEPPTSSEGGRKRLEAYGPYGSEGEALAKIEELRRQPHFRNAELVPSREERFPKSA
jgi:hypothetical protein